MRDPDLGFCPGHSYKVSHVFGIADSRGESHRTSRQGQLGLSDPAEWQTLMRRFLHARQPVLDLLWGRRAW